MSQRAIVEVKRCIRCAIYTRKSVQDGLEQAFNSLDAQRESAEAYIQSQKSDGWVCLPEPYDDGGYTGGNIERPALQRLLTDIERGVIDCVLVYKVDRLSRSLSDFSKLMDVFNKHNVAFVSTTQQFNTAQSMGRLMLNVLLSFAQFEREMVSERTRDKIAATRRKGKWTGGRCVLGYDLDHATKRLVINEAEANIVREVYARYLKLDSVHQVTQELNEKGILTKRVVSSAGVASGGKRWLKLMVLQMLRNVLYAGKVKYKSEINEGEHQAIIDPKVWEQVQTRLTYNGKRGGNQIRQKHYAPLKGLLFCKPCQTPMGHNYSTKDKTKLYRYYVCGHANKAGWAKCPSKSLPADQVESFIVNQIKGLMQDPALVDRIVARCNARTHTRIHELESEQATLKRDFDRGQLELQATAKEAATNVHAAARLADLHDKTAKVGSRLKEVEQELGQVRALVVSTESVDASMRDFESVWKKLVPKEQGALLQALIKRIEYDPHKQPMSVVFNESGLKFPEAAKAEERAA